MNTIDDLRAALERDAASVSPIPDGTRGASVERRIRVTRQRRRAGAAAGVAALAAVIGFGVVPALTGDAGSRPDRPEMIAGQPVPEQIRILDFPYRYTEGVESEPGDRSLTLELDEVNRRRAVSVAVDDLPAGAVARLRSENGVLLARVVGPSKLDAPVPIDAEADALTLSVSGGSDETRVGLATYERTDRLAAGLADPDGTVVFRDEVAGRAIAGGAWLDPASGEASFMVSGAVGEIEVTSYCDSNGSEGVYYVVSVDNGGFQYGRCEDLGPESEDAAQGSSLSSGSGRTGTHQVRMWTTDRPHSRTPVAFPDVVAGVAAYGAAPGREVLGGEVSTLIEWGGRLFELERVADRATRLDPDSPRVLGLVLGGSSATALRIAPDDGPARTSDSVRSTHGGSAISTQVWPGQAYHVSLVDLQDRPVDGAILIYRPVD